MEIRKVKIEEYWPLIVRGTEEFGQIAVAENPEFNQLAESVYRVLKESFILPGEDEHASEYGVSRWEKMLGLAVTPDMTLDDRKAAILTYMSIKLPYTWRVLKQMLTELLGEDNVHVSFDNETQVLSVGIASTVEHLRPQVDDLFTRVVPQNIEITYDPLPIDYTRVEYLESTRGPYIALPDIQTGEDFGIDYTFLYSGASWALNLQTVSVVHYRIDIRNFESGYVRLHWGSHSNSANVNVGGDSCRVLANYKNDKRFLFIGLQTQEATLQTPNTVKNGFHLFGDTYYDEQGFIVSSGGGSQKIKHFAASNGRADVVHLIPALDPTGTPCMFDTVTRTPFYNSGTGDFLYPTDSAPVMTLDLDEKFYAKLTEHGVRRLYKVPEGCTISKDEYAAKHGFKELIEPPMPEEGYWTNVWKETDTQLICEWVETEPPMEVTEND